MLRALVVDDSRLMRNLVMSTMRKTGLAEFSFVEAEDGAKALDVVENESIDLALVDWNMPNMTGIEFVRRARSAGVIAPMVMVTSEKTMGKMEEALDEAGADAYICKPFTVEEMQSKLSKVIEKAQRNKDQEQTQGDGGGFFSRLFN